MIVFPAIDLKAGQVVRLAEGDMDRATVYANDPAAQARRFAEAGADWLHVVDLDRAVTGDSANDPAIERIARDFPGRVQLGGGIRDLRAIARWLDSGLITRLVIGTAALTKPEMVREAARAWPGAIVVAVDARDGMVATQGWVAVSDVPVADLARRFEDAGVAAVLFTDIGRDGLLKGVNVEATLALARAQGLPVIASGGVAGIEDIKALAGQPGIEGVICGRALYDGRLDLGKALACAGGKPPPFRGRIGMGSVQPEDCPRPAPPLKGREDG